MTVPEAVAILERLGWRLRLREDGTATAEGGTRGPEHDALLTLVYGEAELREFLRGRDGGAAVWAAFVADGEANAKPQ